MTARIFLAGLGTVAVIGLAACAVKRGGGTLRGPERPKRGMFPTPREKTEDYLDDGGFELLRTVKARKGPELEIWGTKNGSYTILRADTYEEVGTAYIATKWSEDGRDSGPADYLSIVRVNPAYQRQGIATALYNTIEKHTGQKLRPSPIDQSDAAKAFWKTRKPLGSTDDEDDDALFEPETSDKWQAMFAKQKARKAERQRQVKDALAVSPALIVDNGHRKMLLLVTGEMQDREYGTLRVTTFADDGPMGHATRKDMDAITDEIIDGGWKTLRPATDSEVDAWTSSDRFVIGSKKVAAVQAINTLHYRAKDKDAARAVEDRANKLAAEGKWDDAVHVLQQGIKDLGRVRLI